MSADWPVMRDRWGCDIWQGATDHGYPRASNGKWAYRVAWERENGPLGDREIDHCCREPLCVRVTHLEPVSQRVNKQRMHWKNRAGRKTCQRGHDLKLHGRRTPNAGFTCRICDA